MVSGIRYFTASFAFGLILVGRAAPALAQNSFATDPFEREDPVVVATPTPYNPVPDGSAALMGNIGPNGIMFGGVPQPTPNPDEWTDMNKSGDGVEDAQVQRAYEESYEYKVNKELDKPIPRRQPFGDQLNDLENRLTTGK